MASSTSFLDAVANRRSIYALNKTSPISDDKLESIVTQVLYPRSESISKKIQ
jgi:predicted oxidoreductase (fatty acid repression mutant protein)